jgi:alkylation response protein AidB-like acyl-CoA dehydrogenase
VNFELTDVQAGIVSAVNAIMKDRAGPDRARTLGTSGHDDALLAALTEAGYLDVLPDPDAGPLSATLVVEAVAAAAGQINIGARAIVVPAVAPDLGLGRVALATAGTSAPVRWASQADHLIVLDGDAARVVTVDADSVIPLKTTFAYPIARVDTAGGQRLAPGSGDALRRWWRLAIAAESVGAMRSAFSLTASYLSQRKQFGRELASLQAIQHRLAEAYIWLEGATWLTRYAAWHEAEAEAVAAAAGYTSAAAQIVGSDLHQLTGAIGFTTEYNLSLWTLRLHALRTELGGASEHLRSVAMTRWMAGSETPDTDVPVQAQRGLAEETDIMAMKGAS